MEVRIKFEKIGNYQDGVSKSGNAWRKVEFIGSTDDQYPKRIAFSAFNNLVDDVKDMKSGGIYNITFDIESREWNGKWFTGINVSRIDYVGVGTSQTQRGYSVEQDLPY